MLSMYYIPLIFLTSLAAKYSLSQNLEMVHDIMQGQCLKKNCQCVFAFVEVADDNQEIQRRLDKGKIASIHR